MKAVDYWSTILDRINLPEILKIPDKLTPLITEFDKYRYFILEGGRGGGKTNAIARLILWVAERHNLRIVCGREIQKSITESVYSIMTDLIQKYNLYYEVLSTKITHKESNSTLNFRGFREQGSFNIQGMEGIDIVWIDEAQAITKQTLDVLIPTIRKDKAKVLFSMNRHNLNDPVYAKFAHRDDCLHININYVDNEFCTDALKREAEECRKISESDYNHIWMGHPLDQSNDAVYSVTELENSKTAHYPLRESYGLRIAGYDVARFGEDSNAVVILQQMGALHWETIFVDEWRGMDLNYTTGRILQTSSEYKVDMSIIDEDGIGAGPLDSITKGRGIEEFKGFRNTSISFAENAFFANPRTINAYKLKDLLVKGHICITDNKLIDELATAIKYTFDHNQRRILISKKKLKEDGIPSPNLADALIMAVSLIGVVTKKQETQYVRKTSYTEDLFQIAGIR